MPSIILASGSRYRRELLARLGLPFRIELPGVEELPLPGEAPAALAGRLALEKAQAVANRFPAGLVIGSDQVADCDGVILGKPGTADRARQQLQAVSGRTVTFWTALALINAATGRTQAAVIRCDVEFRILSDEEIARYVAIEAPLDCAGSFKAEGLGVVLFRRLLTDDPTSLIGLPLIALCAMLRAEGVMLPPAPAT
ncbi:MAG: Maf family protein [Pseudomonadota bacterium]